MAIKAIIFDIDGVLAESRKAVVFNTEQLLSEFNFSVPHRKVLGMSRAHSADTVLTTLVPELKKNKPLLRKMLRRLSELSAENILLIKPTALAKKIPLFAKKYRLAAATNRKSSASMVLEHLGILQHFDAVLTSNDAPPKPDPGMIVLALKRLCVRPNEAVFVGDNEEDRMAGVRAGVKFAMLEGSDRAACEKLLDSMLPRKIRQQ